MADANDSKWFKTLGGMLSFKLRVAKHVRARNADRVKDYILKYFDYHSPKTGSLTAFLGGKESKEVVQVLKDGGYTLSFMEWKNDGIQLVCYHKATDSYYRSKFAW